MKRSNHKAKKGDAPAIICAWCRHASRSKYEAKNHLCRPVAEPIRRKA